MTIKETQAGSIVTKSNLPVCDYSVNPYTGCAHACKYCYASFMKRFTRHEEVWGRLCGREMLEADLESGQVPRKGTVHRLGNRPVISPPKKHTGAHGRF